MPFDLHNADVPEPLHPYRKRKFFYGLAELLQEDPPRIQTLAQVFPPASAREELLTQPDTAQDESHNSSIASYREDDSASFDVVQFNAEASRDGSISRSVSSLQESLQDSLLFLPPDARAQPTSASRINGFDFHVSIAEEEEEEKEYTIVHGQEASVAVELVDYFDNDRYCELVPCWAYSDQVECKVHGDSFMRCPMLFFCLQALDEFIASQAINHQLNQTNAWLVASCQIARIVLASMWENDVLNLPSTSPFNFQECVQQKQTMVGIHPDVWRLINGYWLKYKQNFVHQEELYFADASEDTRAELLSSYGRIRGLLQVFGMKHSHARKLVQSDPDLLCRTLTEKHLEQHLCLHRPAVTIPIMRVGLEYLAQTNASESDKDYVRPVVGQSDWKVAFNAIVIHLQAQWPSVHVFPCGVFSRGAAFGSVLDVLVSLPVPESGQDSIGGLEEVADTLVTSKIMDSKDQLHRVSIFRGLSIVPFKGNKKLLLDIKVYEAPKSWFALLYFTGPEPFVRNFFQDLLGSSLQELLEPSFECLYAKLIQVVGLEAVTAVESEQDVFALLNREYVLPSHRM